VNIGFVTPANANLTSGCAKAQVSGVKPAVADGEAMFAARDVSAKDVVAANADLQRIGVRRLVRFVRTRRSRIVVDDRRAQIHFNIRKGQAECSTGVRQSDAVEETDRSRLREAVSLSESTRVASNHRS